MSTDQLNPDEVFDFPQKALEFRFVHASGPGGQHVNKASTAVELRVTISALLLGLEVADRLREQQKNRINKQGQIVIQANQFRSQLNNRKDAVARLGQFIEAARVRPKRRIATHPSYAAKRKRMDNKANRGRTKLNRRKPALD